MVLKRMSYLVLISTIGLSGCMDEMMKDDASVTKAQGAGGGALLGAALGGLIGGDAQSALIGAAIGGGLGYVVGNEVAKRKQAYASQEDLIAGETQRTVALLNEVKSVNSTLQKDIANYKKEIKKLNKQVAKDASKRAKLEQRKSELGAKHAQATQAISDVEKELETTQAMYDDTATTATDKKKMRAWEKRINELKAQKVKLEENTNQLQAVSSTIAL
jgi:hypothetical protein